MIKELFEVNRNKLKFILKDLTAYIFNISMFSSTANLTATSRFNGFSQNSLFVSIKNLENKVESREKID